jgi:small-conductance mechanosensitive channel
MSTNIELPKNGEDLQVQARSFVQEAGQWLHSIQDNWLTITIATTVAVIVFFGLHMIRRWGLRLCKRGEGVANWYAILGRAVAKTGNFFILMTAIRLVIGYVDAPPMLYATATFLFTIAAVFQATIWLREVILGAVENRTASEEYQGSSLSSAIGIIRMLVTVILFSIALVVVLSNLGVNVTGLVAGLGVGGIAIGLAAQGTVADLLAALAIIFDKPFRVGDTILYDKSKGVVERIGLKSTRIRGPGGEERIIANKKLLDYEILNSSNRQYRRMALTFAIANTTPADKLAKLADLAKQVIVEEKLVFSHALLNGVLPGALTFEVEFDSPSPSGDLADAAKHRVVIGMIRRLEAEGIQLYVPAMLQAEA